MSAFAKCAGRLFQSVIACVRANWSSMHSYVSNFVLQEPPKHGQSVTGTCRHTRQTQDPISFSRDYLFLRSKSPCTPAIFLSYLSFLFLPICSFKKSLHTSAAAKECHGQSRRTKICTYYMNDQFHTHPLRRSDGSDDLPHFVSHLLRAGPVCFAHFLSCEGMARTLLPNIGASIPVNSQ